MVKTNLLCSILLLALVACNDHPTNTVVRATDDLCSPGEAVEVLEGRSFCVYRYPIVIETGFRCPSFKPEMFLYDPNFGVCTDFGRLNDIEFQHIFDRFGTNNSGDPWGLSDSVRPLDLLFVVDNSGSMCQEQDQLTSSFRSMAERLNDVDFHIAITTTHMEAQYPLEPLARPGTIQSTPQPLPGFDATCRRDVDDNGEPIDRYTTIADRMAEWVACMREPDPRYLELTETDFRCADLQTPGCRIEGFCDGDCSFEKITPPSASFRTIDPVLRASDYRDGETLDVDRLVADFSCAARVGTRGYGFEKGLGAAVLATSRELTGGAIGLPATDLDTDRANHGFIRTYATFGLLFVTDENDCTHDGSINEAGTCGDAVCSYAQVDGSNALEPIERLRDQLLANLAETKQRTVELDDVVVASIHGDVSPFDGPPQTDCNNGDTGV